MKWKRAPSEFLPEKTFLIIKDDLESLTVKEPSHRKKSKSAADTGTWPPKIKKLCPTTNERPKTANLERPSVLNPSLVNKLDMSLLSKEVLSDSMTQIRHGLVKLGGDRRGSQSLTRSQKLRELSVDDQVVNMRRQPLTLDNKSARLDDNNNRSNTNNRLISSLSSVRVVKTSTRPVELEVFTGTNNATPEPCTTCGRPDQPERLHSHPKGLLPHRIINRTDNDTSKLKEKIVKKTVQKPVALNFQSGKNMKAREKSPPMPVKKGPRTVTCYICAREFGTASFPIHEPKCMQRWERENDALPPSQKRPPPQRPAIPVDHHDWNTAAWELSQTQLVPCWKCGRTFLPDRLAVHQKSCKATPKQTSPSSKSDRSERSTGSSNRSAIMTVQCQACGRNFDSTSIKIHEPHCLKRLQAEDEVVSADQQKKKQSPVEAIISPTNPLQKKTITCYICGRDFGTTSIEIHQPQCLKKWHIENSKLPASQRRPEPKEPEVVLSSISTPENPVIDWTATAEARWKSHLGQLVACKQCKRTFNPERVAVHERTCKGTR